MENRNLRLLLVDDDEGWRTAFRMILKDRPDLEITEAASGSEALEKVKTRDFDLVLLDMRMPSGTEGLDALVEIKKLKPKLTVIMISAYGDIPKTVEAMKRGALDFVPKEADFKDVITLKINDFIGRHHLVADRERLIRSKYEEAQMQEDIHRKGRALEELTAALFESIDGFIVTDRVRTETEEIDIVIRNESKHPFWEKEDQIILAECKNWKTKKVGKNEFVLFMDKMENRSGRCRLGFLICTEEFAGTIEKSMLRSSKTDLLVVPINGERLRRLIETEDRSALLIEFVESALAI